ncbi:hypothetical protein SD311_014100 (plasmid) [Staphylococcus sp. KG4-3]|nr:MULTISPECIES: hypothetical protein [Staphylococcus]MDW8544525.1 hypothetical protein [Staphylococcus sp. KG4-1]MDW8563197.1 hypothetical protein [Staphylococcus sp. KG4-3]MDW8571585.1 hypothetical protein [Staphylococcus shinii]MDW8574376.1 hypothetical protein [Staphylococcus shinii]
MKKLNDSELLNISGGKKKKKKKNKHNCIEFAPGVKGCATP